MGDVEELRLRLDAVEAAVARLREDAEATRTMASLADRDVAEHRQGLRSVVNALRMTQLEQGQVLGMLVTGQARAEARLVALESRSATLVDAVEHVADGQQQLAESQHRLAESQHRLADGWHRLADGQQQLTERVDAMGAVLARLADKFLSPEA